MESVGERSFAFSTYGSQVGERKSGLGSITPQSYEGTTLQIDFLLED